MKTWFDRSKMMGLLLLPSALLLIDCGKGPRQVAGDGTAGVAVQAVASQPIPDQRATLAGLGGDMLVLECTDVDFNTTPIAIGDRRFTIAYGGVYKGGRLTHVIHGAGLTEGVLVIDCSDGQRSGAVSDMTENWNAVRQNLFRKDSTVHFMNEGYQIERVSGDSVFAQPIGRRQETVGEMWVFVGKMPDYRRVCHLDADLEAIDSCPEHSDERLLRIATLCHRWASDCYCVDEETCMTAESISGLVADEYTARPEGFLAYVYQQDDRGLLEALLGTGQRLGEPTPEAVKAQIKRLEWEDARDGLLKMLAE